MLLIAALEAPLKERFLGLSTLVEGVGVSDCDSENVLLLLQNPFLSRTDTLLSPSILNTHFVLKQPDRDTLTQHNASKLFAII